MHKRIYIIPAGVILFILFFTVFGERGLLRIHQLRHEKQELQKRAELLKGENEKLKREIEALRSDRRYLESIARRDFGLVRANEIIYQFPVQDVTELKNSHPPDLKKNDRKTAASNGAGNGGR
jgi:cell division protein FtsB